MPKKDWANYESHASAPSENPVSSRFVTINVTTGRVDIYETSKNGPQYISGPHPSVEAGFVALAAMNETTN